VTKIRTCRGAAKRFKITGTGKIMAYGANHGHKLGKKSMRKKKLMLKKRVLHGRRRSQHEETCAVSQGLMEAHDVES